MLNTAAGQAKRDLLAIESASRSLGRTEKTFVSKYRLTCNADASENASEPQETCQCHKSNIKNLQADLQKTFYPEFRRPYDVARVKVDDISAICDNLIAAIATWKTKVAPIVA